MPLLRHALPTLPWQFVGTDFCTHEGKDYIILVDFYSFYFEVEEMKSTTASKVKEFCLKVIATHGLPLKIISDNGPPFGIRIRIKFIFNQKPANNPARLSVGRLYAGHGSNYFYIVDIKIIHN